MREAFKARFIQNDDSWSSSKNVVVKEYQCPESIEIYKNDVIMQSEAKLMAEKFNSFRPPVKIDFLQLSYIQMASRGDDDVVYHMESFIEGIKFHVTAVD